MTLNNYFFVLKDFKTKVKVKAYNLKIVRYMFRTFGIYCYILWGMII